tara:strand:+ start:312 stop:719 length:408 start_codon:yes stop_codon:yes gene_type:complete
MSNAAANYVLARLSNFSKAAEGATLPPKMGQNARVPSIKSPFVARAETVTGGTVYTLVFDEPRGNNIYAIYYKLESALTNTISQYSGPATATASPISIFVPSAAGKKITFYLQTQLSSGFTTPIQESPTCTSITV